MVHRQDASVKIKTNSYQKVRDNTLNKKCFAPVYEEKVY